VDKDMLVEEIPVTLMAVLAVAVRVVRVEIHTGQIIEKVALAE
jgi:hypothetical protein